jgi:hypothetical protein
MRTKLARLLGTCKILLSSSSGCACCGCGGISGVVAGDYVSVIVVILLLLLSEAIIE